MYIVQFFLIENMVGREREPPRLVGLDGSSWSMEYRESAESCGSKEAVGRLLTSKLADPHRVRAKT